MEITRRNACWGNFFQPAPKYHTKGCSSSSGDSPGARTLVFVAFERFSSCEFRASIARTPFCAILWRSPILRSLLRNPRNFSEVAPEVRPAVHAAPLRLKVTASPLNSRTPKMWVWPQVPLGGLSPSTPLRSGDPSQPGLCRPGALSGPLNRLNAILSLLHSLDRCRTPSAIGSAIGEALSCPISHQNACRSPRPPCSKPLRKLNRAIVAR